MQFNKRAVSTMVSYALLVVIGIAISAIAYPYLKNIVTPPQYVECPPDMSVSIEEVQCNRADWSLSLRLLNRGLFNVTGVYIRFAHENWSVRPQINTGREVFLKGSTDTSPLAPGQETSLMSYNVGDLGHLPENGTFIVEVQPAVYEEGVLAPCAGKIVTQAVECFSRIVDYLFDDTGDAYACEGNSETGRPCSNINDTDPNTKTTAAAGESMTYYVNYTKQPDYHIGSNWSVKWGQETTNITLPSVCFSQKPVQFKIVINRTGGSSDWYTRLFCHNGSDFVGQGIKYHGLGDHDKYVYEEWMLWYVRS